MLFIILFEKVLARKRLVDVENGEAWMFNRTDPATVQLYANHGWTFTDTVSVFTDQPPVGTYIVKDEYVGARNNIMMNRDAITRIWKNFGHHDDLMHLMVLIVPNPFPMEVDQSRFPHKCRCGSPAYFGATPAACECSRVGCRGYAP